MKLNKLIKTKLNINVKGIKTNSNDILKGDIFVCSLGLIDKHSFINDAIKNGCRFVITNRDINDNIPYLKVDNIDLYLKNILDKFYDYPLNNVQLIGITGTDGKTTTCSIIRDMLSCASIGTNGLQYKTKCLDLRNTTPSLDKLYECFNLINKKNIKNIVMEVSSESYLTNRIPYLTFDIGIFTNITKEHLDKHKSFDNYFLCKMKLFENSKLSIINHDSKYFHQIIKHTQKYVTYGKKNSTITIKKYKLYIDKTMILFKYNKKMYKVISPLVGKFNIYNLMASILCLISLNYDLNDILNRIDNIKQIPGRIEVFKRKNDSKIIIDYAHTINATLNILKFVRKYSLKRIITVVGCAGGRYKEKRGIIGKYVLRYSHLVIFTMDDPRNEDVNDIINDMLSKTRKKNYYKITDRKEAIKLALNIALKDDIILILGKGRDNYMAINNEYVAYNDMDIIKHYM